MAELTIFTARLVRTMEPSMPMCNAVAVRDGHIVEVGSLETMRPWLDRYDHEVDDTFSSHVLMPGFIDPHLHPTMAAVLLPMEFTTAVEWDFPWGKVEAVGNRHEFLNALGTLNTNAGANEPLFAWGHHPIWHGEIDRNTLNAISTTRPIVVWHRGYHSLIVNDACLDWMELDSEAARNHPHVDLESGRFFETGLNFAYQYLNDYLLGEERLRAGLEQVRQVVHRGGQTTIGDAAIGLFGFEEEWTHQLAVMEQTDTPFRIQLMPYVLGPDGDEASDRETVERFRSYVDRNTHRLRFSNHVKMFADGGFFAELLQLEPPGHLDGRAGEWITPPERFSQIAAALWQAGFNIHVHTSGDGGVELALATLEDLMFVRPRFDHRFTFEHLGISTSEQVRRMAELGALASVQVNYVYELSRAFADHAVGYERASQMSRLGTLERAGVPFAIHSDFTMAPAQPLHNAWVAVNRINESGEVMGANERASMDAAMRAITSNAALVLGLENEVGSLRSGKKADFTVLETDPYEVALEDLSQVPIWGTVFEGQKYPI